MQGLLALAAVEGHAVGNAERSLLERTVGRTCNCLWARMLEGAMLVLSAVRLLALGTFGLVAHVPDSFCQMVARFAQELRGKLDGDIFIVQAGDSASGANVRGKDRRMGDCPVGNIVNWCLNRSLGGLLPWVLSRGERIGTLGAPCRDTRMQRSIN
ncbi:unnamed protein product [Ostreobium quekettii]|uniref:Uncharacterized protein n=1 Tax=Ostreobium quekettii TaxID=121088 RepID=A0A8S1J0J9_9CHLO|nr:unnamed protein product [Ostreobium quekettii]